MKYPPNTRAVVDVTQAPYYCDNTGQICIHGERTENNVIGLMDRRSIWDILLRDTQGSNTREFSFEDAFPISWYCCRLFGYVSRMVG